MRLLTLAGGRGPVDGHRRGLFHLLRAAGGPRLDAGARRLPLRRLLQQRQRPHRGVRGANTSAKNFSPAAARIGQRVNVPDLNGIDYDAPVGSYLTQAGEEIFLRAVPRSSTPSRRRSTKTRKTSTCAIPERVAKNYLSLSIANRTSAATRRREQARARGDEVPDGPGRTPRLGQHRYASCCTTSWPFDGQRPVPGCADAVAGRPPAPERRRRRGGRRRSAMTSSSDSPGRRKRAWPRRFDIVATLRVPAASSTAPAHWRGNARPVRTSSPASRARPPCSPVPSSTPPAGRSSAFPATIGDGALAFGVIAKEYHRAALQPAGGRAQQERKRGKLDHRVLLHEPEIGGRHTRPSRTGRRSSRRGSSSPSPPGWPRCCAPNNPKNAPPVYVSDGVRERHVLSRRSGSQAEDAVRKALASAARRPSGEHLRHPAQHQARARAKARSSRRRGTRSWPWPRRRACGRSGSPMPVVELALPIGQPAAVVAFTLDVGDDRARGTLRLLR